MKISLGFYCVKIHTKRKPDDLVSLVDLPHKEKNIVNHIQQFLGSYEKYDAKSQKKFSAAQSAGKITNADLKKVLYDPATINYTAKHISGVFRAGEGGFSSDLVNAVTGNLVHERSINDVELIPFYFRVQVLQNPQFAVLALQRFGVHGVASTITSQLQAHLAALFSEYTVKIEPVFVGGIYLDRYITGGEIKQIEATQFIRPKDKASKQNNIVVAQTVALSPEKRGQNLPDTLKKILYSKNQVDVTTSTVVQKVFALFSLNIDATAFNELKFQVDFQGVRRTVDIGDISRFATYYDVTDEVTRNKATGHPDFQSIDAKATAIVSAEITKIVR